MKIKLERLVNCNTGKALKIYIPKDKKRDYEEFAKRAESSGCAFRNALNSEIQPRMV